MSVGVVALRLALYVKGALGAWVVAYACEVGPVAPVGGWVFVYELSLKVFRSRSPFNGEVMDEVGGGVLSASVAHPPCGVELSHVGVYEGLACLGFAPSLEAGALGVVEGG